MNDINADAQRDIAATDKPLAVIVGYGPVGRVVDALLRDSGMETVVIDLNMDTVQSLTEAGRHAIYGDATNTEILEQAGIRKGRAPGPDAAAFRQPRPNGARGTATESRAGNHRPRPLPARARNAGAGRRDAQRSSRKAKPASRWPGT